MMLTTITNNLLLLPLSLESSLQYGVYCFIALKLVVVVGFFKGILLLDCV